MWIKIDSIGLTAQEIIHNDAVDLPVPLVTCFCCLPVVTSSQRAMNERLTGGWSQKTLSGK